MLLKNYKLLLIYFCNTKHNHLRDIITFNIYDIFILCKIAVSVSYMILYVDNQVGLLRIYNFSL